MPRQEQIPPTEKSKIIDDLRKEFEIFTIKNVEKQKGFNAFVFEKLAEFEYRLSKIEAK